MGKGRSSPCCDKSKVRTGPWSSAEDYVLVNFIRRYGHTNWRALPRQAGLLRCGKSCRLRWINYLRPGVKRGNFTPEEEQTIINMHNSIGKKWSKIASCLPGRTDNEIKNVWNSHLKKRPVAKINNSDDDDEAKESTKLMQYCSSISSGSSSITAITSGDHHPDQNYYMQKSPNSNCSSNLNFFKAASNNIITSSDDDHRKIEIPSLMTSDFDYNFWELLEPLENDDEYERKVSVITDQEKLDGGEEELRKSLRFLENELGLANHDQDDDDNAGQQMTINFKPLLDCSTLRHLGI